MKPDPTPGQFLLYTAPDGAVKVDVFFRDETVWLTQKALAELFGVKVPAVNKHLKNIFASGELRAAEVISILETTTPHGAIAGKTQTQKTQFQDKGKVSALEAKLKAEGEFEVYRQQQDAEYISDFDREIKRLEGNKS
ncbi:MAG: cell filamentation protein Fic [Verrucomicrobiales bacterium]|nr:cell filamentation protein Fic [Verrucomicrobiales bacterium]